MNVISQHGVGVSNAITILFLVRLRFAYPSPQFESAKYGIRARQMLKTSKKQYAILIGIKHLKIFQLMQKMKFE